jgi:uncharacterized protein (DUF488 family)
LHPFYTIDHLARSIAEFVDLLRSVEVTLVVDVRTLPRSRTNPQYDRETLPDTLPQFKVSYEHIASLAPHATFHPASMHSGRTRAFIITWTTP